MKRVLCMLVIPAVAAAQQLPPGHPPMEDSARSRLVDEIDRLGARLDERPLTFEERAALGNLFYENGRFRDAIEQYRRALEIAAPWEATFQAARARLDAAAKGKKRLPPVPAACARAPGRGLADVAAAAEKEKDPLTARLCWDTALSPAHAARARRANAQYLTGDAKGAAVEHERLLERAPDYPESLFFLGAMHLEAGRTDPARKEKGRKLWERLIAAAPDHPRAEIARKTLPHLDEVFSGGGAMPPGHPPAGAMPPDHPSMSGGAATPSPLSSDAMEAIANTDRGPEFEKGMDQLVAEAEAHLLAGRYDDALVNYRSVMPYRPTDPRVAAGMGGALRGLGRPTAERVLQRALEIDGASARANYEYGRLLLDRGERERALQHLKRAERDAAFAKQVGLAALIAQAEKR